MDPLGRIEAIKSFKSQIYPKKDDRYSNKIIKSITDCTIIPGMNEQTKKKAKIITESIKDINNLTKPDKILEYIIERLRFKIFVMFNMLLHPFKITRQKLLTMLMKRDQTIENKYTEWYSSLKKREQDNQKLLYSKKIELLGLNEEQLTNELNQRLSPLIINVLQQLSNKKKMKEYSQKLEDYEISIDNYFKRKQDNPDLDENEPEMPYFINAYEEEEEEEETTWKDTPAIGVYDAPTGAYINRPITLDTSLFNSSIPLKTKYIIHPAELLIKYEDTPSDNVGEICRDYKQSFYTPGELKLKDENKNYLDIRFHIDYNKIDFKKNDQEKIQCCYKDLYLLENGKKVIDIKLKQIKLIEKYVDATIKSDIENFDRTKINTDIKLLDELRNNLDCCPFLLVREDFKAFLNRSFDKFNEMFSIIDNIRNDSTRIKTKEIFISSLIELSVTANRYSLLNTFKLYKSIENEINSCNSRTNTRLREQLHLFAFKKRFQKYLISLKGEVETKKKTFFERVTTTTTLYEHFNDFIDAISGMKFGIPILKIGTNIEEDDVKEFIKINISKQKHDPGKRIIERHVKDEINTELRRLKTLDNDDLFNELNGGEPLLDLSNWLEKLKKLGEDVSIEKITTILTTFCIPDMLINDNVPIEIFLNELFDVIINFMNESILYFINRYSSHDPSIMPFEKMARDIAPILSLSNIGFNKSTTDVFKAFNIHNVGVFSFSSLNSFAGLTGISALLELFMKLIIHFIINIIKETEDGTNLLNTVFSRMLSSTLDSIKDVVVRRMTNTYHVILSITNGKFLYNTLNTIDSIYKSVNKNFTIDPEILAIKNVYPMTGFGINQLDFKYKFYLITQNKLREALINAASGVGIAAFLHNRYPQLLLNTIKKLKEKGKSKLDISDICILVKEFDKLENSNISKNLLTWCQRGLNIGTFTRLIKIDEPPIVTAQIIEESLPQEISVFARAFEKVNSFINPFNHAFDDLDDINFLGGGNRITRKFKKLNKKKRFTKCVK